ncbi:hypothetical protein OESDEN_03604 [Oesophagostomum dentatum]|uniref:Uncharacterized protein n=1 Tax=Oesophagostomum dentatum TaxID=61180 RepID=A0A0B1TJZ6_OESDE|nr:hypothetical protein OESDEN_03604 [Oesophagostomum dentatum]
MLEKVAWIIHLETSSDSPMVSLLDDSSSESEYSTPDYSQSGSDYGQVTDSSELPETGASSDLFFPSYEEATTPSATPSYPEFPDTGSQTVWPDIGGFSGEITILFHSSGLKLGPRLVESVEVGSVEQVKVESAEPAEVESAEPVEVESMEIVESVPHWCRKDQDWDLMDQRYRMDQERDRTEKED